MARDVALFHSVLSVTPPVLKWAEQWRAAGHTVPVPDLFDGETFETIEDSLLKLDALGVAEVLRRAQAAVLDLAGAAVFSGFSMGAAVAEFLAATPPGAHAQIHHAKEDPWTAPDGVSALESAVRRAGARGDVHVCPVAGHLFSDPGAPENDEDALELLRKRALKFLEDL